MKISSISCSLFLIIFLLFLHDPVNAQVYAERSFYRDTYASAGITRVELINKYGNIKVNNWNKDSIRITTGMYLSSSTPKKLNKLKKLIKIKYVKEGSVITAQTLFGEDKATFVKEIQDFTRDMSPGTGKKIEIDYEIFLPPGIRLELNDEFGDIMMESIDNALKVVLSNGSFTSSDIDQDVNMKFKFVKATMNDLKNGYLEMKYSTVNIHKATELNIVSKSSEIYMDDVVLLKLSSSRDKIDIGELDYLYGTSGYSDVTITLLNKELDCYFSYGGIIINNMGENISLINISSEKTDIKLYIPKKIVYRYDIFYNENADLLIPQKNIKPQNSPEVEGMKVIKGSTGREPVLDLRIKALKKCNIQILRTQIVK